MEIFNRGRDLARHTEILSEVVLAMAHDMERICKECGCAYTKEEILGAYLAAAEGPTIFERVLIDRGSMSETEAKRNCLAEDICQAIKKEGTS